MPERILALCIAARSVLLATALGALPCGASALTWLPVARSGEIAPEFPAAHFDDLDVVPGLSGDGEVFFHAFTPGEEVPTEILYSWTLAEGASIVATAGSESAGFDLLALRPAHANDTGAIAYAATRSLPCLECVTPPEILVGPAAVDLLAITAQSGDPAIGGPTDWVMRGGFAGETAIIAPGDIRHYNEPEFNEAGQMIARASIGLAEQAPSGSAAAESALALFFFDPLTGPTLIAREGGAAPGFPDGATMQYHSWNRGLGAGGVVAFSASVTTTEQVAMTGVFRWSAETGLESVARSGTAIPGEPVRTFHSFARETVDAAGNVAFVAMTESVFPSISTYDIAIWLVDAAGVMTSPVPFEADAPGLPNGAFFTFIWDFLLADDGAIAFASGAVLPDESNTTGIWLRNASGVIRKLFVEGDAAPGIAGATFRTGGGIGRFQLLGFAPSGALTFSGIIEGDSIDASNDQVFYRIHPNGRAELLLREGDPFEFAAGDVRPVQSATLTFDRDLEFAAAEITSGDASAIYFSALPEPGSTLLGGIAIAALGGFARARMRSAS